MDSAPSQFDPQYLPRDLLKVRWLGRFLRWRWSRTALQIPLFVLSMVMIANAIWGPQLAPKNLGVLLTWVHFRGLIVLVLLLCGNLFCMACPFMLPRDLARRWLVPLFEWPKALRNKWPAIFLFVAVLFVYELWDLWSNPRWTGLLIVAYFLAAFGVDALFKQASFCKFVCPVGQFNFLGSTLSPLTVAIRDADICDHCATKDCIRGTRANAEMELQQALPILQRGCELALFQPRKVGNLDCTFCLDCVYACPHENVGILTRVPVVELIHPGTRSGIGTLARRTDFSALAVLFTFGALLNAFAMISPVYALEQWLAGALGLRVEWPILALLFIALLVVEPILLVGAAAYATRRLVPSTESTRTIAGRFARSLVPFGLGVWLAHYGFHFFTGFLTVIPVAQNTVVQIWGRALLGSPQWQLGGLPEVVVYPMEIGFLLLGVIGSLIISWAIAAELAPRAIWKVITPWAALYAVLFASAVWIMSQPMDMRGTFLGN
ncbi:MAG: hypothetical protein KDB23_09135 [Planctomycetales bacterium]|nr:hypothetical protein [Planctomycetales bacterium]